MENKITKLIDRILETTPTFWDNPGGGHVYTCPFCGDYKEVNAIQSVAITDLNHDDDCPYKLAQELYFNTNENLNNA